jgi:hypothetical protein
MPGPSINYYRDPVSGQLIDVDEAGRASQPDSTPQRYPVRALQCALAARGVNIDVDGFYGAQTRTYLASALAGYKAQASADVQIQQANFESGARTNATSIQVSRNFASWLFTRAPQCQAAASAAPAAAARTATTSTGAPRSSLATTPLSLPFWRRDNWKAWLVGLGGAAAIGGVGFYGYKKRWFR